MVKQLAPKFTLTEQTMFPFHGSDTRVRKPTVNFGRATHDFGQAFYLTTDFLQAAKWAKHRLTRNGYTGLPIVSIFEFDEKELRILKVQRFAKPSPEW